MVTDAVVHGGGGADAALDDGAHHRQVGAGFIREVRRDRRGSRGNERGDVVVVVSVDEIAEVHHARHLFALASKVGQRLRESVGGRAEALDAPGLRRALVVVLVRVLRVGEEPDREQRLGAHHLQPIGAAHRPDGRPVRSGIVSLARLAVATGSRSSSDATTPDAETRAT